LELAMYELITEALQKTELFFVWLKTIKVLEKGLPFVFKREFYFK
jgi:hypothetical protein